MPRLIAIVGGLIFTLALVSQAEAQSVHVNQSGQSPTSVKQMPGGVYLIQTPGQSRTNIKMMPGDKWVVETPGQLTIIKPMPNGGYRIQTGAANAPPLRQ
jgi:translation initiation factor IF-1